MDIVLGVGLIAATALYYAFGFAAHRRAVPSKWTAYPGLSMLYAVTLTLLGPIALGFVVKAALDPCRSGKHCNCGRSYRLRALWRSRSSGQR